MLTLGVLLAAGAVAGVHHPDRLTAGPSDQFLGTLSPDGMMLYFVSDEQATTQIYAQDMARGIPRVLFDDIADASWPRPSPDGKRLLYISYQTDAAGDVCVRDLKDDGKVGDRRCLTGEGSSELQAIWLPDGKSVAVITRSGLHGNFELRRIPLSGGTGERMVAANLSSPAFSPDGRYLAYVPVDRPSEQIGPSFLSRAGTSIAITTLGGEAVPATLELPGASGFPAFSEDGKWLYFTQFLNDTNLDGSIDGNDNGVLFRAPFDAGKLGGPQQLTSARWSCQYPLPAKDRLIATCLQLGSLDVFSLPLDGGVPSGWSAERIDDERSASTDRWEQLLLLSRRTGDPAVLLADIVRLHLELGEHESAIFYARRLEHHDKDIGELLGEIAAHRKAERALSRGMLSGQFVAGARERLARAGKIKHPLAAVARSEFHDTLGEETHARAALEAIDTRDPLVAGLYAERLLALYRGEQTYFDLYRPLAEADLGHAQDFVSELVRGLTPTERKDRITATLAKVRADSEVAFLLELELGLADLSPETQEPVRERVFQIYRKNKEFGRRKALVSATIGRAVSTDNEYLLYNFANTWVSYVPEDRAERRRAEGLYRDAVLERGYVEEERGKTSEARGHYYGVTLVTDALEAHAAFLEARITEGQDPLADYKKYGGGDMVVRFANAYLAARKLPAEKDPERHEQAAIAAITELQAIADVSPQRPEIHHLWGYVAHQRWLRRGEPLAAVEANAHYLLALDLARESPRHRAAALEGLGRLQSSVGNHSLARAWLEERSKLPFHGDLARFSHCLAQARARFHSREESAAAKQIDECQAETGPLARYRPLALDRSGLYHLVAGEYAPAAERYAALWAIVAADKGTEGARNRLTTQVGWATASLGAGDADAALEHITAAEKLLSAGTPALLEGPYGRLRPPAGATPGDYGLLLHGLRAQAHFKKGQLAEATAAMTRRRDGLAKHYKADELDEDLLELASAEAQLGLYAHRQKAIDRALGHVQAALRHWDAWSKSTNSPVEDVGIAILCAYAELFLFEGLPEARWPADLASRLEASYTVLSQLRNPAWETGRARIQIYLTLLTLRRA